MVQAIKSTRFIYEEPLPGEKGKAWETFNMYLNLGAERSLDKVRQQLGRPPGYTGQLEKWSKRFDWVKRALQFDVDQEVLTRQLAAVEQRQLFIAEIEQLRKEKKLIARKIIAQGVTIIDTVNKRLAMFTPADIAFLTPLELAALSKVAISNIQFASLLMDESLGLSKIVETLNGAKK